MENDLISRQAAIDALTKHEIELPIYAPRETDVFWNDAIDCCISEIEALPSAQQDVTDTNVGDMINRQAAISRAVTIPMFGRDIRVVGVSELENLSSIEPEQRWIPFKTRELTDEEKEEHPEWDCILECKLPEDGQRILVSINLKGHEEVQYDEFYSDDGSYLDSGYEIGSEAVAWMPLPEAYREEK